MIRRLAAALVLLAGVVVAAPTPAAADSSGIRWRTTTVCVENWMPYGSVRYNAVAAVVRHANTYTNLSIWHKGPHGCGGFSQRIGAGQAYAANNWAAWTASSQQACTLPSGRAFKCFMSPVTIKMNTRYSFNQRMTQTLFAHELGHALGLGHVSFTCDTVMRAQPAYTCGNIGALSWYDRVGTSAHPGINRIYAW